MSEFNPQERASYVNWSKIDIRYSDLDPNSHVNNGAINSFFEQGRVEFRNARMGSLGDDLLKGFVLVSFNVQYHKALHYPGNVEIGTVVKKVGNSSYVLGQAIFKGETCIASAESVTVCIDQDSQKAKPIADTLRGILEGAQSV